MNRLVKASVLSIVITSLSVGMISKAVAQSRTKHLLFDSAKAVTEIAAQNELYKDALSHSESIALRNLYTRDAEILNAGIPSINGRSEIISFIAK